MSVKYSVNERLSIYTRDIAKAKLKEANQKRAAKGKVPLSRTALYEIAVGKVKESDLVKA